MNTEFYRNFTIIVETGNLNVASRKIHIAQSALSNQVKSLEEKFGTPLLIAKRGVRKITLTDAGKILYQKARYICDLEDNTAKEIENCTFGGQGTLRLSLSPSTSISVINDYLSDFSRLYPNINFELYEVPVNEQSEQLLSGFTEIGIANAPMHNIDDFNILYTTKENLGVVCALKNPWISPDKDTVTVAELKNVPIALSRGCAALFKEVCRKEHFAPTILSINTTKLSSIMWAKQSLGVAVVPLSFSENHDPDLIYKVINDMRLTVNRAFLTVKNRTLSPVAQKFIDFCSSRDALLNDNIPKNPDESTPAF